MKITKNTRTRDLLPLLTKDNLEQVLEQVPEQPLEKPLLSMSVAEFGEIVSDEEDWLLELARKNRRALDFLGKLKRFQAEMNGISSFLKRFECTQTNEEKSAASGVLFPTLPQRMLLECCEFFHLHSFEDAEKCKVSDWLLVFQNNASSVLYQRNYSKIIESKNKLKSKKK